MVTFDWQKLLIFMLSNLPILPLYLILYDSYFGNICLSQGYVFFRIHIFKKLHDPDSLLGLRYSNFEYLKSIK